MESNKIPSDNCGDVLHKGSSFLSFISLLLIVALSLKMESINSKTLMNEMRISKVESRIEIGSPQTTNQRNEMETPEDSEKTTSTKVRRSLISTGNKSLSMEDVRSEITKHFNKLKPASLLCQPLEKVCVPGPPGKKGNKGSRGRRGVQGIKGKKGVKGKMGLPGRHGQQGIMRNQGAKGEKGEKGDAGPRGFMGLKGDPGESISSPEVIVSPTSHTVTENQTAAFNCSVRGNPRPTVTWSKVNASLVVGHLVKDQNGGLQITKTTFNDSGDYMCTAVNVLGRDEKTAKLTVEVGPQLVKVPDRFLLIEEGTAVTVTCEAFSYPPSKITWTRAFVALPKGRNSVRNGTLIIENFSMADSGTYVCIASNKLGSVTAITTLGFQRQKFDSCQAIKSKHSKGVTGIYELVMKNSKFQVYCDIGEQKGWTLIARFPNKDNKNWMRDDGLWWHDQTVAMGTTTDPSNNSDMISPAFWFVSGRELKITRSDDPSHTPLLQTTGNCLAGQTFRSKITSYGDFRNGKVWASNQCLTSCTVQYGGQYKSTDGFQQAECSGNIQSANNIGFWCDWDGGDGSVMMIGGGGSACERADHGIGITEADAASFVYKDSTEIEFDFGYEAHSYGNPSQSYSLNLWIR